MAMERPLRVTVFVLCLVPFAWLLYAATAGGLGPDPAEAIMHDTGEWSLRLLALTLLISPLRSWTGWPVLKLRRMLGLYAFFYACVHFLAFLQFFTGWTLPRLLQELAERPYITMGFLAWLLMLPLAITSTRGMQRRLKRNWARLHQLVYPAAVFACLHLFWQARSDIGQALVYIGVFAVLLAWRVHRRSQKRLVASQ
ncbi:MAG: protein-methionine-sulfoxide reductase heme-binding subunit MsrQ [Pseudomonadota bacterium]